LPLLTLTNNILTRPMQPFDILDRYRVRLFKNHWLDNEFEIAHCLGFELNGNIITVDIRRTYPEALLEFIKTSFSIVMLSAQYQAYRTGFFNHLKKMYVDSRNEFKANYEAKLNYPNDLFMHQGHTLAVSIYNQWNYWAFEQGLGKTITSATLSKSMSVPRTIIICPALVKWNWFHNMTDDWGFNPILWTILDSKKNKCVYAFRERFVVINYEMISKFFDYLNRDVIGHIIIDECHYIKNHKTNRFKAVEKLVRNNPKARVTLLSGTPVTNRSIDYFAYCKLAGHPLGKNFAKFKKDYCLSSSTRGGNKVSGSKNIGDLRIKMSNFMIRKKSEECIDLPALIIKKYYFDVGELSSEYNDALEELYMAKKKYESAEQKEKAKLRLTMSANIHSLNRIMATSKVQPIKDLINEIRAEGRKVVVFSGYTDPLKMLEQEFLGNCVRIAGDVGSHKRQQLIDKFKKEDDCFLFLGNFQAAGIGINLTNANDVIFMNFPLTPDQLEQPYKRCHRIGQKEAVRVYYTIGKETIDEHVFRIIVDKKRDIDELVDKGKQGVVHYDNLQGQLFSSLFNDYEKMKGIQSTTPQFQKV